MIALFIIGTAAYAGIHALVSPAVATVSPSSVIVVQHAAPYPLVGLDAVILTMIGLLAVVGASSRPHLESTSPPNR